MPQPTALTRRSLLWWLALALAAGLLAGCATAGAELERQYYALAQEEFYVKRQSNLWSRPDRASDVRGFALAGYRVTELDRNRRGWSKVRVHEANLQGWLPTAVLSKKPVSAPKAAAQPQPAPAKQTPAPAKAQSPPAAKSAPTAESGSLLSPPAAHAAPPPTSQPEGGSGQERKADPKKFEPL